MLLTVPIPYLGARTLSPSLNVRTTFLGAGIEDDALFIPYVLPADIGENIGFLATGVSEFKDEKFPPMPNLSEFRLF